MKDERDPARTVAVRAISISFQSIGGEMKSCPIGPKLADCVARYKSDLWWKDERDPERTVAVRVISISFHSIGGEMKSCPIGLKLADCVARYKSNLW